MRKQTNTINWRPIPFIRLLIPFVIGILSALIFPQTFSITPWILFSLFSIITLLYFFVQKFRFDWLFGSLIILFLFGFGYLITNNHKDTNKIAHFSNFLEKENTIVGVILSQPIKGKWVKFNLKLSQIGSESNKFIEKKGNILVYLPFDKKSNKLKYGDQIILDGKILPLENSKNPNAFDYKSYLAGQNIYFQTFIKENNWKFLDHNKGNPILSMAFSSREKFISILEKHLGEENELAVGAALILGYKEFISDELQSAYTGTGAMHVLAVSGLHVGLISFMLYLFLNLFKSRALWWKISKTLLLILGVWAFALITGASASVLRAAVMFSFLILGKSLDRYTNIYNTLAVSAFVLLCFNPFLIKNVGFQLSYLAIVGIIYFQPLVYKKIFVENPILDYAWTLTSVSIAAQITTIPISILYFNQFPLFFWLAGLIVVPAATIILFLGILLLVTEMTIPFLATFIGTVLYSIIWFMNAIIFWIQSIPASIIQGIWITLFQCILLYAIVATIAYVLNTKKTRGHFIALALGILFFGSTSFSSIKQTNQKSIAIYHLNRKSLVDFIDSKKCYRLKSDEVEPKDIDFTAKRYLWAKGVNQIMDIPIQHTGNTFEDQNIFVFENIIQFYNTKLATIGQTEDLENNFAKVDFILLQNNLKIQISDIIEKYPVKQIIFDASNSNYKIDQWIQECNELGIGFYDIRKNGAFIFDVK